MLNAIAEVLIHKSNKCILWQGTAKYICVLGIATKIWEINGCPAKCDQSLHKLTTAQLNGSWFQLVSWFHLWQSTPRLNNAAWLAQPCNPAMSFHTKKQHLSHRHIGGKKKREGAGGGEEVSNVPSKTLNKQRWLRIFTLPKTHPTWTKLRTTVHALPD